MMEIKLNQTKYSSLMWKIVRLLFYQHREKRPPDLYCLKDRGSVFGKDYLYLS